MPRFFVNQPETYSHAEKLKELGFRWCTKDCRFETAQITCSRKQAAIAKFAAEKQVEVLDGTGDPLPFTPPSPSFF